MKQRAFAVLSLAALAWMGAGCGPAEIPSEPAEAEAAPTAPSLEQLANMTYEGIEGEPVTLSDGSFLGEPFVEEGASRLSVELLDELTDFGDLDRDGTDDAAVLLAESSGGSGTRVLLSVVSTRSGKAASYGTGLVGDRPQIRAMRIIEGGIRLELVEQGPGDAACCPTQLATQEWALVEGKLTQVAASTDGRLSLEMLGEGDWVLTHLDIEKPAPEQPEITVRFEAGRIAGSSGCNGYFADLSESSAGVIELGPVGSTRKACPPDVMELESTYLGRLGQVDRYGFWRGQLALTWQAADGFGSFLFTPRSTPEGSS
jgi:heat shock protein HslJ